MNTEHDIEQNALATRLNRYWTDFRQGKLIGYKLMAIVLIVIAATICTLYIVSERRKNSSQQWLALDEANSVSALEEISKTYPNTIQDRLARLQIARNQLGINGIDQFGSLKPDQRQKAIENVEKARESFEKLLPEFNNDPILKCECLLGLAKAEAALVPVPAKEGPVKEGQPTEYKGSIPKVVEYLDQLTQAAPAGTPWATDSKKLADALRDANSATAHEFVRVEQTLFKPLIGDAMSGIEPSIPGMPGMPTMPGGLGSFPGGKSPIIPGVPLPSMTPNAPVVPTVEAPGFTPPAPTPGSTQPAPAPGSSTTGPIAPGPTPPQGAQPGNQNQPGSPIAPSPKGPDTPAPSTGAPPAQKTPEPPEPVAPPPKK